MRALVQKALAGASWRWDIGALTHGAQGQLATQNCGATPKSSASVGGLKGRGEGVDHHCHVGVGRQPCAVHQVVLLLLQHRAGVVLQQRHHGGCGGRESRAGWCVITERAGPHAASFKRSRCWLMAASSSASLGMQHIVGAGCLGSTSWVLCACPPDRRMPRSPRDCATATATGAYCVAQRHAYTVLHTHMAVPSGRCVHAPARERTL